MFAASKTDSVSGSAPDDKFNYVTLLLHGDGTNGAQNNTFLDGSANNFTITKNNKVAQGSFSPFGSNWSNYIDGSSYFIVSNGGGSNLDMGTGDCTIEMWVNPDTQTSSYPSMFAPKSGWSSGTFYIRYQGSKFGIFWNGVGDPFFESTNTYPANAWYHVAVVRSNTTFTMYVNGVSAGTGTSSASLNLAVGGEVWLGNNTSGSTNFRGFLSNVRVVKGTAVYTSAFTPSTTPLTAISGTTLLTCQSNRFVDNSASPLTITTSGTLRVQRFNPFGTYTAYSTSVIGGSAYFTAGDYLSVASNTAFNWGTGDGTMEWWFNAPIQTTNYPGLVGSGDYNSSGSTNVRWDNNGHDKKLFLYINGGGDPALVTTTTLEPNVWHHCAVVRSSGVVYFYTDGVRNGSVSYSSTMNWSFNDFYIGKGFNVDGSEANFTGYISNVRNVKGTAIYTTSTYTVPTAPLTAVSGTQFLCVTSNAGIYDNTMISDFETAGNAQISTSVKKFGTGSLYFDGTGDWLTSYATYAKEFGAGPFTIECWAYVSSNSIRKYIISAGTDTASHYNFALELGSNGKINMWASSNGTSWDLITSDSSEGQGSDTIPLNQWNHIAMVRESSGTFKSYLNGVLQCTVSGKTSAIVSQPTVPFNVGKSAYQGSFGNFNGYIDDLRITRGYARYTANFTPTTTTFLDTGPA